MGDELVCQVVEEIRLLVITDIIEINEPTNYVVLQALLFLATLLSTNDFTGIACQVLNKNLS